MDRCNASQPGTIARLRTRLSALGVLFGRASAADRRLYIVPLRLVGVVAIAPRRHGAAVEAHDLDGGDL